jgi:hypothetical protein
VSVYNIYSGIASHEWVPEGSVANNNAEVLSDGQKLGTPSLSVTSKLLKPEELKRAIGRQGQREGRKMVA